MSAMPLTVDAGELVLRLALTVVAGALLGFNREEHGRPAGLRTTLLVCLAASVAMIQTNVLLPTAGKPTDSFVVLDLMRLPLGILSGAGFLGAGVIFRRSDLVVGVTTAAILWIATVIGLCFGGGQIVLGVIATALGVVTLWGLRWVERFIRQDRRATLILTMTPDGPSSDDVTKLLEAAGFVVTGQAASYRDQGRSRELRYDVQWRAHRYETRTPTILDGLSVRTGVESVRWSPQGVSTS